MNKYRLRDLVISCGHFPIPVRLIFKRSISRNKSPTLTNTKSTGIINLKPMIFPSERPVGHAGF